MDGSGQEASGHRLWAAAALVLAIAKALFAIDVVFQRIPRGLTVVACVVVAVAAAAYADAVQRPGYRRAKLRTLLDTVPETLGPDATPPSLLWDSPAGEESAVAILVSNNPYRLGRLIGSGTRPRLDQALLGIAVLAPVRPAHEGAARHRLAMQQWTATEFEMRADQRTRAGIDGEAIELDPPLRFRIRPGALRVRIAPGHPGALPQRSSLRSRPRCSQHSPASPSAAPRWSSPTADEPLASGAAGVSASGPEPGRVSTPAETAARMTSSTIAAQLESERGWMVPARTLPPDADHIKIMRTLVKETLGRSLTNALAEGIAQACATLKHWPDPLRAESLTVSGLAVSRRSW